MNVKIERLPSKASRLRRIDDIPEGSYFTITHGSCSSDGRELFVKVGPISNRANFDLRRGIYVDHLDARIDTCAIIVQPENIEMDIKFSI